MEDVTLGEVARGMAGFRHDIDDLHARLSGIQRDYVRKDVQEVAEGSVRVEIGTLQKIAGDLSARHDADIKALVERLDAAKERADERFRNTVALFAASFLGPIVTGIAIYAFTKGA